MELNNNNTNNRNNNINYNNNNTNNSNNNNTNTPEWKIIMQNNFISDKNFEDTRIILAA